MADDRITLRSYRAAFELERRIHRIDRFRIPVPYGIPLVALGYWFASLIAVVVAGRIPLIGGALMAVPWPLRILLLPGVAAHLLCRQTRDGRPSHAALAARAHFVARASVYAARRWFAEADVAPFPIVADERGTTYIRAVVDGPAVAVLRCPARGTARGRRLAVTPVDGAPLYRARTLRLRRGQRVVFR